MPSVAKMPSILLTIDRRSPVKSSRSRCARRASSSTSLGIGTIEQTRGSPLSQAGKVRSNISTSMMSVFARRARRFTGRLDGWMTWTSILRRARKRASQNPSRPALMGQYHSSDLPTCRCAPGLQTLDKICQPLARSVQHMPRIPTNSRQLNRQNPLLLAQFQSANDRGVVVDRSLRDPEN